MLEDLLKEELIRLDVDAKDWEDAVKQAASPLLENNKIKQSYIDSIISVVKETGPYFVIAPHIALPHTRPEMGAIENALGVAVLKTPIEFGNKYNDPVKYLFTLSAVDTHQHSDVLGELSRFLDNDSFYDMLDNASTPAEVMEYIRNTEV